MARHSGSLAVNFSDIGDRCARSCLFFLFSVRVSAPRRVASRRVATTSRVELRRAAPPFMHPRETFVCLYPHKFSHQPRDTSPPLSVIYRLIDPLYQPLPNRDISHDQSPGNFRCQAPALFYFATASLPRNQRERERKRERERERERKSEMQATPWRYTIISMIQSHRLTSASPCIR